MIRIAEPQLNAQAKKYVLQCVEKNQLTQGSFNLLFENRFADFLNVGHATTCTNGTMAIWLALKALQVGPGDEVIIPTLTFAATASAVIMAGAQPVFADCNPLDFNISTKEVEALITKKTKAIIVVHLYGYPCDMDAVMRISRKYALPVIEDAAEALGSTYRNKEVGSIAHIGCFSFYANKMITTGEGGMCVSNDRNLIRAMSVYKNHGMIPTRKYWHEYPATNARMTNMHAAIGFAQMSQIKTFIKKRMKLGLVYEKLLKNISVIEFPVPCSGANVVPWLTTIRVLGGKKEQIVRALMRKGIESRPGFYPCHQMPAFRAYVQKKQVFPHAEEISPELVTLPMHVKLTTKDIQTIVRVLIDVIHKRS